MKLAIVLSSILWATLRASGYQSENPSSAEIASSERDAKFFYVQAKDDEAADTLQRNAAIRERKLSSQLRTMIERAGVNLADKQEDYNYIRDTMVSLQRKIKEAKLIQNEHADELRILHVDHNHLQAVENSGQKAFVANKKRILSLRNQAKLVRERREQINNVISSIQSTAKNVNMEERKYGKSIKKQKLALKYIAEKLVLEDRKADHVEREGILAKRRATYRIKNADNARRLEDLSMFDLGQGLIYSDKASTIRREFTKKYKRLQNLESSEGISARKIQDLRRQIRAEIIGMASLKQYLLDFKSAEHSLQGRESMISQQLQDTNKLLRRNQRQAKILSEENEQDALKQFTSEKHQLLTQLGDLSSDEGRERKAASRDQLLERELDRAARLHLLSMRELGDAAADAADSAAKLLAASSLLNSATVD